MHQSGSAVNMTQETSPAEQVLQLHVANLDCDQDVRRIERALGRAQGVTSLKVFPKAGRVAFGYDTRATSAQELERSLRELGFPSRPRDERATPALWLNPKVLASVSSGLLLLAGWLLDQGGAGGEAVTATYLSSLLAGGYYFGREALEDLLFEREIGIELLMTMAAVVATLMGAPGEGAMLAFLYSISEAAEGYTEEKTRSAIKALMDLAPKVALVRREGREVELPVEELVVGDVFIVKPGQSIPTDGDVLAGTSSVNQAPVTGESVPVEKAPGDPVFAGSINAEGALDVRATKAFAENTIARIIALVEEAQERKGRSERSIERFGKRYSPAVLAVGVLVAVVPPLLLGTPWTPWIARATVFIVAAAPCALVISIPVTLVAALGTAARRGILIKGGVYLEELAKVRVVALDKTGTLTRGQPEVTDVIPVPTRPDDPPVPVDRALALAAGIEARSQHPLALAVLRHAEAAGVAPAEAGDFRSLTGAGASARVDGRMIYVGSPELFERQLGVSLPSADIARLQSEGKTVIVVGDQHAAWALLAIRDGVRANARAAIAALRAAGVRKIMMLTGDNERTAAAIAAEVEVDEVFAGLTPDGKAAKVRELTQRYGHVAMVGDGVNDAPALAEATVGIAMGAAGTDVALETADVALMGDDLERLADALQLAKRNQRIVRQNLGLSAVVIGVLVVGAVAGALSLPIAVLGHELSEFVVIASGLRMLRA